jgi:hypothetical protein
MVNEMTNKTLSRRDNMLVESEIFTIYRRPIRDGMWESQHLEMSRRGVNMVQATSNMVQGTSNKVQGIKGEGTKETNPVRHCGLDPQSPFIRCESSFIRREASHLYISGDSDFRQNDGYWYKTGFSQIRKKSVVICINLRHLSAYCLKQDLQDYRMSRIKRREKKSPKDFNMYNPLQAKHSWGYKMTPTLSELRSSSICYHDNHSNHSSDRFSAQITQIKKMNTDYLRKSIESVSSAYLFERKIKIFQMNKKGDKKFEIRACSLYLVPCTMFLVPQKSLNINKHVLHKNK